MPSLVVAFGKDRHRPLAERRAHLFDLLGDVPRLSRVMNTVSFWSHSQLSTGCPASPELATKAVRVAPASARISSQLTWLAR